MKNEKQTSNYNRGHLKIFFGYSAGVGKTYAMLDAAHTAKKHGTDVVVGYIRPDAPIHTRQRMEGLELLPPFETNITEKLCRNLILDGAIKRKPQLVLIDELAHTNSEGCRHHKRYQGCP